MARPKLKPIKIQWRSLSHAYGYAYPEEQRIELDKRLGPKTLMEIAAHEVLHCALPVLDEEAVDLAARHITNVLWRLGFRPRSTEDEG